MLSKFDALWVVLFMIGGGGGCVKARQASVAPGANKPVESQPPPPGSRPLRDTFQFAFSGRVHSAATRQPITEFSVELGGADPAIVTVLNGLGDKSGLFHISRLPATDEWSYATVPLVISAPGFYSVVHLVDLGGDCDSESCPGVYPTPFFLKPEMGSPVPKQTLPKSLHNVIVQRGMPSVLKQVTRAGIWDLSTENYLAQAKGNGVLSGVVVSLNSTATDLSDIATLFRDSEVSKTSRLPVQWNGMSHEVIEVASGNQDVATALLSVGELLPYLRISSEKWKPDEGGPLADLMRQFFRAGETKWNLATILHPVSGGKREAPSLAMGSFLPLFRNWIAQSDIQPNPYHGLLSAALTEPPVLRVLQSLGDAKSGDRSILIEYLKPVAQGFTGRQGPALLEEFNALVATDPIKSLKLFAGCAEKHTRFHRLAPYIAPIVDGLNGPDEKALTHALLPVLHRKNPGMVVRNIVAQWEQMEPAQAMQVLSHLFPAGAAWARMVVPAKQLFAAQILTGIFNEDFADVRVTQDLQGTTAVVVSAQVRDIVKLGLLSNVQKIVVLHGQH